MFVHMTFTDRFFKKHQVIFPEEPWQCSETVKEERIDMLEALQPIQSGCFIDPDQSGGYLNVLVMMNNISIAVVNNIMRDIPHIRVRANDVEEKPQRFIYIFIGWIGAMQRIVANIEPDEGHRHTK